MSKTGKQEAGEEGELKAIEFLTGKGYDILARNYRYKYCEVDLIATKGDILAFIEVKLRGTAEFGYPEQFVSNIQKRNVKMAADYYLDKFGWEGFISFDIISILPGEITHFEDAF